MTRRKVRVANVAATTATTVKKMQCPFFSLAVYTTIEVVVADGVGIVETIVPATIAERDELPYSIFLRDNEAEVGTADAEIDDTPLVWHA